MKTILMVSLLALMVGSIFAFAGAFAMAEDTTSKNLIDNSDLNQAEIAQSLSVIGPVGALLGYAEKTDGSDARHIRMWVGKVRTAQINSTILNEANAIREQYKDDKKTMNQKLKELAESIKGSKNSVDSYQGLLVIGRGKEHVTYRLLSKEIDNDSVSFYILPNNIPNNSSANDKKGFLVGLGKKLGLIKNSNIITSVDTNNLDSVGELTLDRTKFDSITLWKGSMSLDSGNYTGDWNMDLMSAKWIWWPNPGMHDSLAGQQDQGQPFAETGN